MASGPSQANALSVDGALLHRRFTIPALGSRSTLIATTSAISLSAITLAASQSPYDYWGLGLLCLVPWLILLQRCGGFSGTMSGFALGSSAGVLMTLWIHSALQNLGASSMQAALGVGITAAWGGGVHWAALGVVAWIAMQQSAGRRAAVLLGGFVFVDWTWQLLPIALPWVLLGHTQWEVHGVAQLAISGGVPLISGLLAALGGAIAGTLKAKGTNERARELLWLGALACAYLSTALWAEPVARWIRPLPAADSSRLTVLSVQPNVPAADRWARSAQRTNLAIVGRQTVAALRSARERPDLIVWPETVLARPLGTTPGLARDLGEWSAKFDVPIVLGAARASQDAVGTYRNSALWLDPRQGITDAIDKSRAIPVIEAASRSAIGSALTRLLGLSVLKDYVEEASVERPLGKSPSFAVTLCFESIFPQISAERRASDTSALLNLANDSWFVSEIPSRQQIALASFRAIEQRLPLLRVAHGGVSAEIDAFGRVTQSLPFGRAQELWSTIDSRPAPPSWLERTVPLAVALLGGAAGYFLVRIDLRRKAK